MISKPPGLPFLIVFSAVATVILIRASYPYWDKFEMFLLTIPVGVLLLAYWAIRMVWAEHKGTLTANLKYRWVLPFVVAVGVMLALVTDAPFWIRFTLSETSMEAYAKAVAVSPGGKEPCQWAGLYRVCDGSQYHDGVTGEERPGSAQFGVRDWFLGDDKGFIWLAAGEPNDIAGKYGESYSYLKGRWYSYEGGWDGG
ncbi:hypothetical protein [Nonomuraea angiospora]|uniref:hypothetical protein n=1 Tax=Nonomuraea angiospora TaxID=46172 RepID=UPI0029A5D77D|nr:hypothetical protein [Nonomuraea angiospora]MDX3105611.1 hypothetical protein [Nonomuraea angiospora]